VGSMVVRCWPHGLCRTDRVEYTFNIYRVREPHWFVSQGLTSIKAKSGVSYVQGEI